MMRKYFPLEVIERLFIAVDDNDVIDTQVSLPPTITLRCSPEIIHDNYALCLRFWLDGVNRKELLRLTLKQAKGKILTDDERKTYKYMRARYKHLRFAQRLYLKNTRQDFYSAKRRYVWAIFRMVSVTVRKILCRITATCYGFI